MAYKLSHWNVCTFMPLLIIGTLLSKFASAKSNGFYGHEAYEDDNDDDCELKLKNLDIHFDRHSRSYTTVSLGPVKQRLRGKIVIEHGVKVAQFLSVRYASTPKRFHKPEPLPAWNGTRDALSWPPVCVGSPSWNSSEDCLFANIWSPHRDLVKTANRTNKVAKLSKLFPVIVFLHGGMLNYMSTSNSYHGGLMASVGNVVLVTITYRVGVLGFFQHRNSGIYDQIAAIQWVSDHIRYFGGDASRVTLAGMSAEAISIGLLALSPLSSHLFQRIILEGASAMMPNSFFTNENHSYDRVVELANCSVDLQLGQYAVSHEEFNYEENLTLSQEQHLMEMQCLDRLSTDQLNWLQERMINQSATAFSPYVPSELWSQYPSHLLKHGHGLVPKDVLIGANSNEVSLFLHQEFPDHFPLHRPTLALSREQMVQIVQQLLGHSSPIVSDQFVQMMFAALPQNNITQFASAQMTEHFLAFLNDLAFKGPVLKFGKSWATLFPDSNTYMYMFNEPWSSLSSMEVRFAFAIPLQKHYANEQHQFSIRLIQTFCHFAKTGQMLPQLGVTWPKFKPDSAHHMMLQSSGSAVGTALYTQYYDLYDLLYDAS